MRTVTFVCLIVMLGFAAMAAAMVSAAAATQPVIDRALLAPIDALAIAMNRGDDHAIAALMTPDVVITDEVAPYRWIGPNAEAHWSHDDGLLIHKRGVTASHSVHGIPTFFHHDATHAFIMVPLAYDYTCGGKRQHETGLWTVDMLKTGNV